MTERRSLVHAVGPNGLVTDGDWVETKDQDPNGDVRLIQLADIGDRAYLNKSNRYLTRAKFAELRCTLLQPGDVLVARMADPLARACIFPGDQKPCATVVDACIVRSDGTSATNEWLLYAINSPQFRGEALAHAAGTTRQRISRKNLQSLELLLPTVDEQRQIVSKLDLLLGRAKRARIELTKIPRLIERYKSAVLTAAFQGGLTTSWRATNQQLCVTGDFSGIDSRVVDLFDLPKSWTWSSFSTVAKVTGGLTMNAKRGSIQLKMPYLRVANVYANELRLDDVQEIGCTADEAARTRLNPGDLLVVEGNGSIEQIGRVALWAGELDHCLHQNHIIRIRPGDELRSKFALYWLLSPIARNAIQAVASSSSGLHTLSISKVEGLPIPVAPLAEMDEIVSRVESAFAAIDKIASEVSRAASLLQRLDQSTLKKAFRGELVTA